MTLLWSHRRNLHNKRFICRQRRLKCSLSLWFGNNFPFRRRFWTIPQTALLCLLHLQRAQSLEEQNLFLMTGKQSRGILSLCGDASLGAQPAPSGELLSFCFTKDVKYKLVLWRAAVMCLSARSVCHLHGRKRSPWEGSPREACPVPSSNEAGPSSRLASLRVVLVLNADGSHCTLKFLFPSLPHTADQVFGLLGYQMQSCVLNILLKILFQITWNKRTKFNYF